ncbi:hypothetical protein ABFS82_08G138600 [Erythranthe guttata]|uniref:TCP domain-containing protein n=1 Tax=Erythranthe guttata TaxID=4155 RepID=A0A022RTM5_ERYGU|nr:hypothetical protein MIMGU_mgv1a010901mg [Erythranthe guttata]
MFPPNYNNLQELDELHGQETLCNNYYNQHFGQKSVASSTMEEGFDFASLTKPKKRKAEDRLIGKVHRGGRLVRAAVVGKDKHSKVSTARGPRDRRLRLSPITAIQFYDVQDRLGYDRPSKAIDWLIKEAKSAIDALDDHELIHQPPPSANGEAQLILNDDNKPGSGFSKILQVEPGQGYDPFHYPGFGQGFCSGLLTTDTCPEITENNSSEIERLQKVIKAWNYCDAGNITLMETNFQAQPIFCHREPLQSSVVNYSPIIPHFPVFGFSDELSSITAAATLLKDDENNNYNIINSIFQ